MVQFSKKTAVLLAFTALAQGAPLYKRIAQTISASTQKWEQACLAAGGKDQCNPVSVKAFSTLLAAAGDCDQQNAADDMIDLAKQLNNDADMIKFAQIFAQQPRNTPTSQSVPYCQQAPKNAELNGLFQCQFAGADPKTFVGGTAVGGKGTIPLGMNAPLNPAGSCPAKPDGPVPDGQQLSDIVQDPGVGNAGASASSGNANGNAGGNQTGAGSASATASATAPASSATSTDSTGSDGSDSGDATASATIATAAPAATTSAAAGNASGGNGGFQLQNGQDAQKLNAQFASLTADSQCNDGDNACLSDGSFAQCVGGKFISTPCSGGTQCFALPLVNKAGTSIACTTQGDAEARIAATGATGGVTGSGAGAASGSGSGSSATGSASASAPAASSSSTASADAQNNAGMGSAAANNSNDDAASTGGDFKLKNGQDAQKLNAQFASLSADSQCNDGDNACLSDGSFAQCVGGKFVSTPCSGGTQCFALPLVNKPGTSLACTTQGDAEARIAAAGAQGGLTGSN
ncbi:hypothetical protein K474DRAFT_1639074 [Panus rudis PR-1116 ss-1]|nr:hypothetical protein K474DRAFT_1639074 [Panus rudis PR-1116 ss-1]